jgi:hypothetical protein
VIAFLVNESTRRIINIYLGSACGRSHLAGSDSHNANREFTKRAEFPVNPRCVILVKLSQIVDRYLINFSIQFPPERFILQLRSNGTFS